MSPDGTPTLLNATPTVTGKSALPDLPGIDLKQALRYSNGKYSLFLRMQQIFQETHGKNFVPSFRTAIENKNWDDAVRLAHTFKTSARMIGATRLGEHAEALETACRKPPPAEASNMFSLLLSELETVHLGLKNLPASLPTMNETGHSITR